MALDKFGVAHATTTLARGNLVDALDLLGDREEARTLLNNSVKEIKEVSTCVCVCVPPPPSCGGGEIRGRGEGERREGPGRRNTHC
jgi:hypothetical protein